MASIRAVLGTSWSTSTGSHTVTATPQAGDLVVILCGNTGITANPTVSDNNSDGLGAYTQINGALKATSADKFFIYIRNAKIGAGTSTVFTVTGASSTGGGLTVLALSGVGKVGSGASRQTAKQENQAAATPAPVFGAAVLTNDIVIGGVFNATNPATMTPRSSPAYTEGADVGFNNPATGFEEMHIAGGETATTITWGGASGSAFAALVDEIDTLLSGTLSEALDTLAISSSGKISVQAMLAKALETLGVSAVGKIAVQASLSKSLNSLVLVAVGTVSASGIQGTLVQMLAALSANATGQVLVKAALTRSLAALVDAATGKVQIKASSSVTLAALTVSAAGKIKVQAALTKPLAILSTAAAGKILVRGVSDRMLGALALQGVGTVGGGIHCFLAKSLGALNANAAGGVRISVVFQAALVALMLQSAGMVSGAGEGEQLFAYASSQLASSAAGADRRIEANEMAEAAATASADDQAAE